MRAENRLHGFTLVELMITVAVLGIVGLLITPGILAYIPQYRVDRAARALAAEMQLARMRAIARNHTHHVAFNTSAQTITVYEDADNDWSTTNTVVKTIDLGSDFPNVRIDYNSVTGIDGGPIAQAVRFGTSSNPVRATFLPNGMMVDPGVVYLIPGGDKGVRNDRMRAVEVKRAGHVILYRYNTALGSWEEY